MKLTVAFLALAAVTACPANWNNPCVVTDTSDDLRPVTFKTCPASELISEIQNPPQWAWDMMMRTTQLSGRPTGGGCGGLGCEFFNGNGGIYAQQCTAICVNHVDCLAFTFQANAGVTSGCRWANTNDCWGNIPSSSGGQMGGGWLRGICKLFKGCAPADYIQHNPSNGAGIKLWHLGDTDNSEGGKCSNPLNDFNKNLDGNRRPSVCPPGQEILPNNNACTGCPTGTFKTGLNGDSCTTCRTCPGGKYQQASCTSDEDTICFTHADVCDNDEYQTVAPDANTDRACASCATCAAGTMISYGCNQPDPWSNQMYNSDSSGKAKGTISVFQNKIIAGKPVVAHHADGSIAGCGTLATEYACNTEDPWVGKTWTSNTKGDAAISSGTSCVSAPIKGHVVLVHDSQSNKVGCGKLREVDGHFEATIERTSDSAFKAIRGVIKLSQSGTTVTCNGSFLKGMEGDQSGVWHVHEGTSCDAPGGHLMNAQMGFKADIIGDMNVLGNFFFRQAGTQLVGKYELNYLNPNSAGHIHIHDGTSCSNLGGHLLNNQNAAHVHVLTRRLIEGAHPTTQSQGSTGNTQCTPCLAGVGFSSAANSASCEPLQECAVGTFETNAGTATADRACGACTNGPANSVYTTAGSTESNCQFSCNSGFTLTNDGTECSSATAPATLKLQVPGNEGNLVFYDNGVLKFEDFQCVDPINFCGATQLSTLQTELDLVHEKVKGLQRWGECVSSQGVSACEF